MNDATRITSPVNPNQTVGNSPESSETRKGVQILEKDDDFALASMWAAFQRAISPVVANRSKPLTNPQISLYGSYYGTLIPLTESVEGTDASGAVVQVLDYYPFGTKRISSGQDVSQREFIGEIFDESTSLSYLNARYLNSQNGQFLSQDPIFVAAPERFLSDPQQMNSYSYARNNPIILKDPTGEASIQSWLMDPIGSVFYTGSLGTIATAAQFSGRPATSQLIWHSLSINPGNINAGNGSVYANAITSNSLYQNSLQQVIRNANAAGQTSLNGVQIPLRFTEGDAATSFGKIDIYVSGNKGANGTWQISAQGSDKYDFAYQNYNSPAFSTVNNTAYFGQGQGTVSNFNTNVSFTQSVPLSQQTFTTPSGAVVTWGGQLVSGPPQKK